VLVGSASSDDAGVVRLTDEIALILTTDFFTPVVDDPYDFGRIAAANALSDVYAMGGKPFSALNITGFPPKGIPGAVLAEILKGGRAVAREAGIEIVGGHTVKTSEPLYGLAVAGTVHPDRIVTIDAARPGDRLVLTKPIGNALVATAFKAGQDRFGAMEAAVEWMMRLNRSASEAMVDAGVRAATDVTGFGLLGHLFNMVEASGAGAELEAAAVPLLPGALECAREGFICGGSGANRTDVGAHVEWDDRVEEALRVVLFDAQTSGGLLIAVPAEKEKALLEDLRRRGITDAKTIGAIIESPAPVIRVR